MMNSSRTPENQLQHIDSRLLQLLKERIDCNAASNEETDGCLSQDARHRAHAQASELGIDADQAVSWLHHAASICCRATQAAQPVAFLGPIYSYSYLAAVRHFGLAADLVPVATISAAFEEVARGQSKFAVVPIENSTDGRVVDTLGMFARSPAEICGEVLLPVHHCLLGMCKRADVVEVQSKPQALSQCRRWLAEHLPNARLIEVASTAKAADNATRVQGVAAIASQEAGLHHGLRLIDAQIQDNSQNVTRFAVIGNRRNKPTGNDKTSLMFQLNHSPGALAEAMVTFQTANVNLTWIESFPLPSAPNEYLFFVEFEGHREHAAVQQAIQKLESQALRLELLGSYPRGNRSSDSAVDCS